MRHSPTTLSQLRREVEAIERKYARVFAAAILKPVTNQITELWAIAVAKEQPKPDALSCVRKVVAAGFRLHTFTALHIYLKDWVRRLPQPRRNRGGTVPRPPRQVLTAREKAERIPEPGIPPMARNDRK